MLLTPEEAEASSIMDSSIQEYLQTNPLPRLPWEDPLAAQSLIASFEQVANEALGPAEPSLHEYHQTTPLRDGTPNTLKIIRPATKPPTGSPLVALFFGGGFVSGSQEQMTPYARGLARAFGAVVVCVGYRVATQHAFPTQQLDGFDSVRWIAAHAEELGAERNAGFVVGGISAGANVAAVVVRMAQEEPLAWPVTGQWLAVPSLLDEGSVPAEYKARWISRERNAKAPILDAEGLAAIRRAVRWDENSPLRNPLLSEAPLEEVPRTFFQVCGMDPLRDDGFIYDEVLKGAGVETRMEFYPGCPHGFWTMAPPAALELSKRAYADTMTGFGWLLGKEITAEEGLEAMAFPEAP